MNYQPKRVNNNHFSTEKFPENIAFCERDETTHIVTPNEQSYEYKFNDQTIYTLKKYAAQWELIETDAKKIVRVTTGRNLALTLTQGLHFSNADIEKQEERVNILFPVARKNAEKTVALMYYFGGYPANFLEMSAELALIIDRFVGEDLVFFAYSYVPVNYLEWLRDELKKAEILQDGANKTLWVYKK